MHYGDVYFNHELLQLFEELEKRYLETQQLR